MGPNKHLKALGVHIHIYICVHMFVSKCKSHDGTAKRPVVKGQESKFTKYGAYKSCISKNAMCCKL